MLASSMNLGSLEELREFVAESLARLESLRVDQCPLTQRILYRLGRPCAIEFILHGPRQLCLSAIWETERNTILFYGSNGQRIGRTTLRRALRLSNARISAISA
jgi:hypothetical protein